MDGSALPVHGRVLWKVLVLVGLVLTTAGLWAFAAWAQELNQDVEASERFFDEYPLPPDRPDDPDPLALESYEREFAAWQDRRELFRKKMRSRMDLDTGSEPLRRWWTAILLVVSGAAIVLVGVLRRARPAEG